MTNHIVADDLFGKVSKRTWELQRRVLEGTIPAEDALDALQGILEGQGVSQISGNKMESVISEIGNDRRKEWEIHQTGPGNDRFHHTEIGRRYFTHHCCGQRMLQVKVFRTIPKGKIRRDNDEALCTVCLKHKMIGIPLWEDFRMD